MSGVLAAAVFEEIPCISGVIREFVPVPMQSY